MLKGVACTASLACGSCVRDSKILNMSRPFAMFPSSHSPHPDILCIRQVMIVAMTDIC